MKDSAAQMNSQLVISLQGEAGLTGFLPELVVVVEVSVFF